MSENLGRRDARSGKGITISERYEKRKAAAEAARGKAAALKRRRSAPQPPKQPDAITLASLRRTLGYIPRVLGEQSVYFIRCDAFVKIGITQDIGRRLEALRTAVPMVLEVLALIPGGREREKELHIQFRNLRHRGEWFRLEGELAEFIASLDKSHISQK